MRLKLVFAASALAAIVGAGSCVAIVLGFFSLEAFFNPGLVVAATFLLPVATIVFAAVFVYRHTAKRRKLQAFLTTLIAILLTLCIFILAAFLSRRPSGPPVPTEPTPHIALLSSVNSV